MKQPHANRLSVSHPVDMHAHAIITAPIMNTKSEPIANLRIQGINNPNQRYSTRTSLGHRDDYSLGESFTNIAENVPGIGVRGKNRVEAFLDTSSTPDQG
jgi:hypothetical protein